MGVEITYFSLAQFPRSISLQRSLQKGRNSLSGATSFLQIGHFISGCTASFGGAPPRESETGSP